MLISRKDFLNVLSKLVTPADLSRLHFNKQEHLQFTSVIVNGKDCSVDFYKSDDHNWFVARVIICGVLETITVEWLDLLYARSVHYLPRRRSRPMD